MATKNCLDCGIEIHVTNCQKRCTNCAEKYNNQWGKRHRQEIKKQLWGGMREKFGFPPAKDNRGKQPVPKYTQCYPLSDK